ncbi:hypothetical protein [Pinirhizobacter soli]|uniref:hypothetical protein n=1 Tax=Pinirhizobacter soli TaxID=2786953 RepID=UPI00202A70BB|nr:hypothetical protein [Pinirhizobacter soli]
MKTRNVLLVFPLALVAGIASFYFGRAVPFASQWPLFEALRSTAAIIFAVIGAWFAIIYPEKLKFSFGKVADTSGDGSRASSLFMPIVHSTFILSSVLAVGVIAPILKYLPIVREHVSTCRGLSYLVLVTLTAWQIGTVIMTLIPADLVKTKVDESNRARRALDNLEHRE